MITYLLKNKIVEGQMIKENKLTIQTRTPDGKIIKRHKIKHNVTELKKRPKFKRGD